MKRVIVFINGHLSGEKNFYRNYIKEDDLIVCADGGAKHSFELGIIPSLILGDLDSIPKDILEYYQKKEVQFKRFSADKDKTDTQLLLEYLLEDGHQKIIIFAALGGRLDHSLGNLYLLEGLSNTKAEIKIVDSKQEVEVITDSKVIFDKDGHTISFLPLSSQVSGVNLSGFKYELKDGIFKRGDTLGLSNVITSNKAEISVADGHLLMIVNKV